MGKLLSVKQLEAIRDGAQSDKTQEQLAEEIGVSLASITRIAKVIREGRFPQFLERAQRAEAGLPTPRGPNKGPDKKILSPIAVKVRKYYQPGMGWQALGRKVGCSGNTAKYWVIRLGLDKNGTETFAENSKGKFVRKSTNFSKNNPPAWLEKARAMHAEGIPYRAIADKLGIKPSAVSYYLTDKRHRLEAKEVVAIQSSKEHLNGDNSNVPASLSKYLRFEGYALAKIEDHISVLAQRANFPADVLAKGLAKLLGHSTFRE